MNVCKAYTNYEEAPAHPGDGWTRFVCLSDTHSRVFTQIPTGDVLIHAGDLSSWGYTAHLEETIDWLKTLDHPIKLIVADEELFKRYGNPLQGHDPRDKLEVAREVVLGDEAKAAGIRYLEHEACTITTPSGISWKVYGSPAAPEYSSGAFQYRTDDQADAIYARIPEETQILITHTPPHGVLDLTRKSMRAGCHCLSHRLTELTACRLHVFGHIHEAHGVQRIPASSQAVERVAVNAAMAHLGSRSKPTIIDLKS
ncbi:hypothetical protein ONZ45_g10421 [Pleurotus djamor]|nr:hypothetical protein ONZ45_g10421 [Pleurotus djamor]